LNDANVLHLLESGAFVLLIFGELIFTKVLVTLYVCIGSIICMYWFYYMYWCGIIAWGENTWWSILILKNYTHTLKWMQKLSLLYSLFY